MSETIPGDQTSLFDIAGLPQRSDAIPLTVTHDWAAAVKAAGEQCQHETLPRTAGGKGVRCSRTLNGGHRLYVWSGDGKAYCATHFDVRNKPRRPTKPRSRKTETSR